METQTLTDVVNTASQMSMWDLVWASDMVTKVVMIGLIAASVWSWAIIIEKFGTLRQVKQLSKKFEETFWSGGSLDRFHLQPSARPDVGDVCGGDERVETHQHHEVENRPRPARGFAATAY